MLMQSPLSESSIVWGDRSNLLDHLDSRKKISHLWMTLRDTHILNDLHETHYKCPHFY